MSRLLIDLREVPIGLKILAAANILLVLFAPISNIGMLHLPNLPRFFPYGRSFHIQLNIIEMMLFMVSAIGILKLSRLFGQAVGCIACAVGIFRIFIDYGQKGWFFYYVLIGMGWFFVLEFYLLAFTYRKKFQWA